MDRFSSVKKTIIIDFNAVSLSLDIIMEGNMWRRFFPFILINRENLEEFFNWEFPSNGVFWRRMDSYGARCFVKRIINDHNWPSRKIIDRWVMCKEYLRHETTEKCEISAYQSYLAMAWIKKTRRRRSRRWGCCRADNMCWWTQHLHQTFKTFNFRQRFEFWFISTCNFNIFSLFLLYVYAILLFL